MSFKVPALSSSSLLLPALLLCGLAVACTAKEGKKEKESAPTTSPIPADDDANASPCLRLEDEEEAEDEAADEAAAEDTAETTADTSAETSEETIGTEEDCDASPSTPSPATPSTDDEPSGGSGGWNDGPGLEGCAADNKAWIAVKNGGPAVCGPELVSWCCSEAEILKQFPSLATKLQAEFTKRQNLKLYHCSFDGTETRFHWAKYGSSIEYSTVFVKGAGKVGGTAGTECTKVTSADLGIPVDTGSDEDEEEDEEVVEVGENIPASIGTITDTSKAGLLTWSKDKLSKLSVKDAVARTVGTHGRVKGFYNGILADSMGDFATKHPKNAIAGLQLLSSLGAVKGYVLMAKATDGTGADSWLFYKISGGPDFEDEPEAYGLGVETCAECHNDSTKDYIRRATLP